MVAYRTSSFLLLAMLLAGWAYHVHRPDLLTSADHELVITLQDTVGGEYEARLDLGQGYLYAPPHGFTALPVQGPQRFTLRFQGGEQQARAIRIDVPQHTAPVLFTDLELHHLGHTNVWHGNALHHLLDQSHNAVLDTAVVQGIVVQAMGDDPYVHSTGTLGAPHGSSLNELLQRLLQLLLPACAVLALLLAIRSAASDHRRKHPTISAANTFAVLLLVDLMVGLAIYHIVRPIRATAPLYTLELDVTLPLDDAMDVFHAQDMQAFSPYTRGQLQIEGSEERQTVGIPMVTDSPFVHLRLDPGSRNPELVLHATRLSFGGQNIPIPLQEWTSALARRNDIADMTIDADGLHIRTSGKDPYIVLPMDMRDNCARLKAADEQYVLPVLVAFTTMVLVHIGLARSKRLHAFMQQAQPADTALVCLVLVVLFLPMLALVAPGLQPERDFDEKRRPAPAPPLRANNLGAFADGWDAWYRDHFGFRRELFRWNALLHVRLLHTSHLPDKVLVGRNGWLFQMGNNVEDAYRGIPLFSAEELAHIVRFYEKRQAELAQHGIRYYLMMPPIAGPLHPENLPTRLHRVSESTWLDQVRDHFEAYSTVPFIDPRPLLIKARETRPIYFSTDIHWNTYGAYWGYKALIERIAQDLPAVGPAWLPEEFRYEDRMDPNGDLAHIMGLNDVLPRVDPTAIPLRPRSASFHEKTGLPSDHFFLGRPTTWTNPDTTLPRLLMFHDSFGLYMKPLLSEHFSTSTYVWTNMYLPDVVRRERPDVVVQEMLEMFTHHLLRDSLEATLPW